MGNGGGSNDEEKKRIDWDEEFKDILLDSDNDTNNNIFKKNTNEIDRDKEFVTMKSDWDEEFKDILLEDDNDLSKKMKNNIDWDEEFATMKLDDDDDDEPSTKKEWNNWFPNKPKHKS